MSSAFFRRPTDASSGSSSGESSSEEEDNSPPQLENFVGEEGETATTESLASHGSVVLGDGQEPSIPASATMDEHRTNLLSALLEDFAKTRACEMLNNARPGSNFTRSSAEIQPLARTLFQHVSQSLSIGGLLPSSVASDGQGNQQTRATYLAGIEGLALGSVQTVDVVGNQNRQQLPLPDGLLTVARTTRHQQELFPESLQQGMADLSSFHGQGQFPSPYLDLTFHAPSPRRSHYDTSFQQLGLLGKGGFGRVYHTYNIFDKKEYAVKKIPLDPRLSQRYRESGHKELESILREVQALAQLEHNNVVRYHATWIEEPRRLAEVPNRTMSPSLTVHGRKLIAKPPGTTKPRPKPKLFNHDDGIVFGTDSASHSRAPPAEEPLGATWSGKDSEPDSLSVRTSDIFTDGLSRASSQQEVATDDSVYVLHVQMSVYPMTLAQYLAPPTSTPSSKSTLRRRHCFHLVPALRILMGILCGLQYIHAKGLVHRDIKPSNIFLSSMDIPTDGLVPDGYHDVGSCVACPDPRPYFVNPRIGDFGLVADLARDNGLGEGGASSRSKHDKPVGTEYYRPPARTDMIDEKLDVFALGVILVEMLWCCTTNSERLHILRDLQKGKVPDDLEQKIEREGQEAGTASLVVQGITRMLERDRRRRWGCAEVKNWAESILLKTCASPSSGDIQCTTGGVVSRVVTLEAEAEAQADAWHSES